MTATLSLTQEDIFEALREFLLDVLPDGVEVVQGQVNRVPSPKGQDYVVFWPGLRRRLSTNIVTQGSNTQGIGQMAIGVTPIGAIDGLMFKKPTEINIQVDVHGPNSADFAEQISTLFRSSYACEFMAQYAGGAVQPLSADDPMQMSFENGEKQIEDRWVIGTMLQANPVTTTVQQFADTVTVGLKNVDAVYPPGA